MGIRRVSSKLSGSMAILVSVPGALTGGGSGPGDDGGVGCVGSSMAGSDGCG